MKIKTHNLSRTFRGKTIFSTSTLESPEHGIVALRGPNGSGKTTFFRVLATLTLPTIGDAWVNGFSVRTAPRKARAHLGFVPATEGGFFRKLTGFENLMLFGTLYGLAPSEVRRELARLSEVLPLKDALITRFAACSTGMKQALAITRALLHSPSVLILDEPTRSLDPQARTQVFKALQEFAKTKLILFSTHREEEWLDADQVWEISEGALKCA